jgi:hypothetical protein
MFGRICSTFRLIVNWAKVASRNRPQFLSTRHSLFTPRGGHEVKVGQWLTEILMVGSGGG